MKEKNEIKAPEFGVPNNVVKKNALSRVANKIFSLSLLTWTTIPIHTFDQEGVTEARTRTRHEVNTIYLQTTGWRRLLVFLLGAIVMPAIMIVTLIWIMTNVHNPSLFSLHNSELGSANSNQTTPPVEQYPNGR